jgi:hypothetical protein
MPSAGFETTRPPGSFGVLLTLRISFQVITPELAEAK